MQTTEFKLDQKPNGTIPANLRATVAAMLITHGKRGLVIVQSAKDPQRKTWSIPQGGIDGSETISQALVREMGQELSLPVGNINIAKAQVLGEKINTIPPERKARSGDNRDKYTIIVAVSIVGTENIKLNSENHRYKVVHSPNELWAIAGGGRPEKLRTMFAALKEAHKRNMIFWDMESFTVPTEQYAA